MCRLYYIYVKPSIEEDRATDGRRSNSRVLNSQFVNCFRDEPIYNSVVTSRTIAEFFFIQAVGTVKTFSMLDVPSAMASLDMFLYLLDYPIRGRNNPSHLPVKGSIYP